MVMDNTKFRSNIQFSLGAGKETATYLDIISHQLNKKFNCTELSNASACNLWTEAKSNGINTNDIMPIHLNEKEISILFDFTRHDKGKKNPFFAIKTNNHDGQGSIVQLIPDHSENAIIRAISKAIDVDSILKATDRTDLIAKIKICKKGPSIKHNFFPIPVYLLACTNGTGPLDCSSLFNLLFIIIKNIQAKKYKGTPTLTSLLLFANINPQKQGRN